MSRNPEHHPSESEPILVTGASGFLGTALVQTLVRDRPVYALSRHPIFPGAEPVTVDLTRGEEIRNRLDELPFSCCIHAAALADPDRCEEDPEYAWRINVEATRHLASVCAKRKKRLFFLSTDYVFDGRKEGLYTEEDPVSPLQVYGATKAAAEKLVLALPQGLVLRLPFLFGYAPPPERAEFATDTLRRLWIGEPAAYDHRQRRTPLIREEAAEAIRLLTGSSLSGILHLVPSESATKFEMALAFARHLGKPVELVREKPEGGQPPRAPRPPSMRLSNAKFLEAVSGRFRFRPLGEALARVAEQFRSDKESARGASEISTSQTRK